jgi:hypothetical protein
LSQCPRRCLWAFRASRGFSQCVESKVSSISRALASLKGSPNVSPSRTVRRAPDAPRSGAFSWVGVRSFWGGRRRGPNS